MKLSILMPVYNEQASVANAVVMATPVTTTLGRPFPVESPVTLFPTSYCHIPAEDSPLNPR